MVTIIRCVIFIGTSKEGRYDLEVVDTVSTITAPYALHGKSGPPKLITILILTLTDRSRIYIWLRWLLFL
jgi:hypothetical protein